MPRPSSPKTTEQIAKEQEYENLAVIERLPHWRFQDEGNSLPEGIEGAKIVRFGAAPVKAEIEGGGLIIDYIPIGSADVRRVVLGFNELGMWQVYPE